MAVNSTFDIVISYSGDPTYQSLFQQAADRWEQVIVADIPDVNSNQFGFVDDLLIDASVVFIDGNGGILGQAGPDWVRSSSYLPFHGIMEFDSADVQVMYSNGTLFNVILHEMGHILGIGTLWSHFGLVNTSNHTYSGPNVLAEYRALTGNYSATSVPVESGGGAGTRDAHWSEAVFNAELMTGYVEAAGVPMPLSRLTVAALADLGYAVNMNAADPYSLPGGPPPNQAPTITSNGAGTTASVTIQENTAAVTTVTASDPNAGQTLTFSLIGGEDQARFTINAATGALAFASAPNFEVPTDSNHDNVYVVQVRVSDGSLTDMQTISVIVTDVEEGAVVSIGGAGIDYLLGGSSDDVLDGKAGPDDMRGGAGNDVYYVDNSGDVVTELAGQGQDTIVAYTNYTLPNNVEIIYPLGGTSATGNGDANVLSGVYAPNGLTLNGAGGNDFIYGSQYDDTLIGGLGSDDLRGFGGNDTMQGGANDDAYFVDQTGDVVQENSGEGNDTIYAQANYTLPVNVEILYVYGAATAGNGNGDGNVIMGIYGGQALTLDGGGGVDTLYGSNFGDLLIGGAGSDALHGQGGNDTMQGGGDDDAYFVDDLGDVVQEGVGAGNDVIYAQVNYTLSANVEMLNVYGAATAGTGNDDANVLQATSASQGVTLDARGGNDTLYGSNFADLLIGGDGNDLLWGFGGNDTMQGGIGDDVYLVEQAGDVVQEAPGAGADTVYASVNITLADNVESLFVSGAATAVSGNSGDNLIVNHSIATGITLTGNGGNDRFLFTAGNANNVVITDFVGNGAGAGDQLEFSGYGPGATFTNIDATHWQVNYNGGSSHDILTFTNGASIHASEVYFI